MTTLYNTNPCTGTFRIVFRTSNQNNFSRFQATILCMDSSDSQCTTQNDGSKTNLAAFVSLWVNLNLIDTHAYFQCFMNIILVQCQWIEQMLEWEPNWSFCPVDFLWHFIVESNSAPTLFNKVCPSWIEPWKCGWKRWPHKNAISSCIYGYTYVHEPGSAKITKFLRWLSCLTHAAQQQLLCFFQTVLQQQSSLARKYQVNWHVFLSISIFQVMP